MHSEPVLASMIQSMHATRNLWTAVDLSPMFTDSVNAITEFMTVIDRRFLKMRDINRCAFPEGIVLGTMVYHPTWLFERRKVQRYDAAGRVVKDIEVHDAPVVRHIPLKDWIWPANAMFIDPDHPVAPARWVGHRFKLTQNQLRAMGEGQKPFLPDFDKEALALVLERETEETTPVEEKVRDLDQYKPAFDRKIELFRIEARFDVDDDGIDEDIIVIFHQPTATVLQAVHNFWHHGKRLYEIEQYIQAFSMLGYGLGRMNEWAQAAASRILNAGINNALVANASMYGVPEGALGFSPDMPIYPGKMIPLAPGEEVQQIRLGEVYPSMFQYLEAIMSFAEQRDSVNDLRTGNIQSLPSRTPATTVMSMLQLGGVKFDMIQTNWRQGAIANIGKRTFQMLAQRHQAGSPKWARLALDVLGPEDAQRVIDVLSMPIAAIEEGLGMEVTATSSEVNKEIKKQNMVGLAQLYAQAGAQWIQASSMIDPQLAARDAAQLHDGGIEIFKRLLEAYDLQNPERYLPQPIMPQLGAQQGMGAAPTMGTTLGGPQAPQPGLDIGALLGIR